MIDSKIEVKMVCPGKGCANSIVPESSFRETATRRDGRGNAFVLHSGIEYICAECGTIMVRRIIRTVKTETETEIKTGETV